MDPKLKFDNYCKANDMRCTPERHIIIDEIYKIKCHFNIDDLYLRIRNTYPHKKLSRGSVYRTIPHLVKSGLIRECFVDQGHTCYEVVIGTNHHEHLKCMQCGKIFEFSSEKIDEIESKICKKLNFQMIGHSHILYGFCKDCRATNRVK